jgi:hypothetical protein
MIRALAHTQDGPLLIFGLSAANITKLQEGLPIYASLDVFGMPGSFLIVPGDTEDSIAQELMAAGIVKFKPEN